MTQQQDHSVTTRIFISYSRKDTEFVRLLHTSLVENGIETWVDWEGIPLSADWWAEIEAGIESTDAFAFVISPDSLKSKVCGDEIQSAIDNNKRIVPILHKEPEKGDPIHPKISSHNWVFMHNETELNEHIADMVQTINTDLGWVKAHTRLLVRANEWQSHSLNSSFLLRGDDLSRAEDWLNQATEGKEPQATELQIDYIHASRREATRRRRLTIGSIAVGLIIAVLALLAVYNAIVANRQTEIARQQTELAEEKAEKARVAEAEAGRQEELAAASLELAALSSIGKNIQPLLLAYSIQDAVERAAIELNRYEYKIDIQPERIVARGLLDLALFSDFMSNSVPEEAQTTSMFQIFRRAVDEDATLSNGREFDSAILYTKFCQQVPNLSDHKIVLPACEQAVALADQLENAWLSFQVCNLKHINKLNSYSEQIEKICAEFDNMIRTIDFEETVQDEIDPGSNDVWLLNGQEDQTIYIYMKANNSDLDSYLDLYDTKGVLVWSDDQGGGANDALIGYTPENTEVLYIVAHGYDLQTEGAYELLVSNDQPETILSQFEIQALTQGELAIGDSIQGSLQPGERHGWTFFGEANQTIGIFMGALDSDIDSFLGLIGPDGQFLAEDDDSGGEYNSFISMTLPDSGVYQIQASAYDPELGGGDYTLELFEEAADFFSGEPLGQLEAGTAVAGYIDAGVNNLWTFSGNVGDVISLAMIADGSDLDPFMLLLAPDGNIVQEDDDSFGDLNSLITVELPQSGIYTAVTGAYDINSFGEYLLELSDDSTSFSFGESTFVAEDEILGDAYAEDAATIYTDPNSSSAILTNVPRDAYLGVIGRSENGDWLYVEYTDAVYEGFVAANRLTFDGIVEELPVVAGDQGPPVTESEAFAFAPVNIFASPDNNAFEIGSIRTNEVMEVIGRSENGSWLFVHYLAEDGNEVDGFVPLSLVTYAGNINVLPVGDDPLLFTTPDDSNLQEEGTLRIGESVTAVLDLGSVHAWTFTGTAGDIVSIAMVSPDGELDIYLILLDSDGNVLIEDDDSYGDTNSLISDFELPESGTYTIQAAAFDDNTSGVYELTITEGS